MKKTQKILSIFLSMAMLLSCIGAFPAFAADELNIIAEFADYHIYGEVLADDGYIGIPVEINTYKKGDITSDNPIILYVINTNTERIGTEADEPIISDLLDEGFIVLVVDYKNHEKAVSPDLDWSTQKIRLDAKAGTYINSNSYAKGLTYVIPAGCRLERNVYYWSIDKHGSDGDLEQIVSVWNNVFKEQVGANSIKFPDGTSKSVASYTESLEGGEASDITQLVKRDGTPLNLDLAMEIVYPSNPENEVPVMCLASSTQNPVGNWETNIRPHMTGYLFGGYAVAMFEHVYVPMARGDHYGYFDNNGTGDDFTLQRFSGIKSEAAAIRRLRYLAAEQPDKYKFDVNHIGGHGHSKSGYVYALGNPHPEDLDEMAWYDGHTGETRYENGDTEDREFTGLDGNTYVIDGGEEQPWLYYPDTNEPIPSNLQMVYSSAGNGHEYIAENFAPTFTSVGENDASIKYFYPLLINNSRYYNIPSMNFSMPGVGHHTIYGYSERFDVDMYKALLDFSDYHLKDSNAICTYITPLNGSKEVDANEKIEIKFTGPVSSEEIESKVKVTNSYTGQAAEGKWVSDMADTTWIFEAYNLDGGCEYNVYVPKNVTAKNGKTLAASKSSSFKIAFEQLKEADGIYSDNGMTVTKTADGESNVYFVFDADDYSSSSEVKLRFSVENDAANNMLVYNIAELNEENISSSTLGEQIGKVYLTGKDVYEIDVTDYVKNLGSGEKAAFVLKAEKTVGKTTLYNFDFESENATFYEASTLVNNPAISDSQIKSGGFATTRAVYNPSAKYFQQEDVGRKYDISFDIYLATPGVVRAYGTDFGEFNQMYKNWYTPSYILDWPEVNTWTTYNMTHRIEKLEYSRMDTFKIGSFSKEYYVDNVKIDEIVSEAEIALDAALVIHPAQNVSNTPVYSGYVRSGDTADSVIEDDILKVSGRSESYSDGTNKKVYAKFDISDYSGNIPATIKLDVTSENSGTLYVYGIADDWSASTINYTNAPSNDRTGFGIDSEKLLTTVSIGGTGSYSVDVTDFAKAAKTAGKDTISLAFAKTEDSDEPIITEDFNSGSVSFGTRTGGGTIMSQLTEAENCPEGEAGGAWHVRTNLSYQRIKYNLLAKSAFGRDLTEADIGKSYTLTYYMKSDKADSSIANGFTSEKGSSNYASVAYLKYETPGQWQKMEYNFKITESMISSAETYFVIEGFGSSNVINDYYIDNLTLAPAKLGNIDFTFSASGGYKKTLDWNNKESLNLYSSGAETGNSSADIVTSAVGLGEYPIVLAEEANYSGEGGKGLKIAMDNESYGRYKFYNLFENVLTTEDVGKTFKISFMINPQGHGGYMALGFMSHSGDYKTVWYESDNVSMVQTKSFAANSWHKVEYTFTVDEGMLVENSSLNNNPALFTFTAGSMKSASATDLNYVYVDDMTIEEIIPEPYSKTMVFDDKESWSGSASGVEAGNSRDMSTSGVGGAYTYGLSDEENHTSSETGKSLKITMPLVSYGRYKFYNLFEDNLTEEDVGDKYKISFWAKSKSKASYFAMGFFASTGTYGSTPYEADTVPYVQKNITAADTWQKVEYEFTITDAMLASYIRDGETEAQGAGNNPALFTFLSGGLKSNSDNDLNYVYIDDLTISHIVEGAEFIPECSESAVVANTSTTVTDKLSVDTKTNIANPVGIQKAYISFAPENVDRAYSASLNLNIEKANGETLNVYGITGENAPFDLTYNTAPASNADESIDLSMVYGGAPITQITANAGIVSIDVTDYVKSQGDSECLFVITSTSTGDTEYLNLDFEAFSFTEDVDYTSDGDVSTADGSAYVSGSKLTVLNAFGSDNTTATEGEVYTLKADITADNDGEVLFGLADASGEIISNINVNLTAGAAQSVEFEYTAEEGTAACSVVIEAKQAGFTVDNIKVLSDKAVQITKEAELAIEVADEPEIDNENSVTLTVSVIGGDSISINGINKGANVTEQTTQGNMLTLTASGAGKFMYWIDTKSNTILSYDISYSYTAGTDRSLAAIYADDEEIFITFTSMANKLVASGVSGSITVPENPYVYGYQFDGWYIDGQKQSMTVGEIVSSQENTEYKAGFIKDTTLYKVTVDGTASEYIYNEKVTVSTDAEKDGKAFSYWKRDGVIVSYSAEYSFYANGNTTVESVYGENVSLKAVLAMANPVIVGTDKIAFFAERDIPTDCEIIETGILMGTSEGLTIENAPIKATAKNTSNKGQFTVRKASVKSGDTYYAVAYAIYRDASGSIVTAYSNEVSKTL